MMAKISFFILSLVFSEFYRKRDESRSLGRSVERGEVLLDSPSGRRPDRGSDIFRVGRGHARERAESSQQNPGSGRSHARDGDQGRLAHSPGSAAAVACDREAVGLVPETLQKPQGRILAR